MTKMAIFIEDSGRLVMDLNLILLHSKSKINKSMILSLLTFDSMPIPFGFSKQFQIVHSINHQ